LTVAAPVTVAVEPVTVGATISRPVTVRSAAGNENRKEPVRPWPVVCTLRWNDARPVAVGSVVAEPAGEVILPLALTS
jgi:hypothetical protein